MHQAKHYTRVGVFGQPQQWNRFETLATTPDDVDLYKNVVKCIFRVEFFLDEEMMSDAAKMKQS